MDLEGRPSMDISVNPNGSMEAIEGIFSPDGRVLGKMTHTERRGPYVAVNILTVPTDTAVEKAAVLVQ